MPWLVILPRKKKTKTSDAVTDTIPEGLSMVDASALIGESALVLA